MGASGSTLAAEDDRQEAALWASFVADRSRLTREALFIRYQAFARRMASRHFLDRRGDVEFPDLCQLAYAGLLESIDRFDPALGVPFRGYAQRRIAGSVLDGIAKMSEVREQISFRNRVRDERARSLAADNPQDMSSEDAMAALADAAIGLALGFMFEGTSIYVPGEPQDQRADAYESVVWKDTVRKVMAEVGRLSDREQFIIRQHYLQGLGFEAIGNLLGITKGRVSQLHRAALMALKKRL